MVGGQHFQRCEHAGERSGLAYQAVREERHRRQDEVADGIGGHHHPRFPVEAERLQLGAQLGVCTRGGEHRHGFEHAVQSGRPWRQVWRADLHQLRIEHLIVA
ncbi:hypothetical protein D3C71_1875770 [compost metagenome]